MNAATLTTFRGHASDRDFISNALAGQFGDAAKLSAEDAVTSAIEMFGEDNLDADRIADAIIENVNSSAA